MFLKELWAYSKKLTVGFILFILFWAYINYKQGATAAPIFQYGMYSGKFFIADTLQVIQLYANDQRIDFTKYGMADRDVLQTSLQNYIVQQPVNESVYFTIKRIFGHIYIGQLMNEEEYTNTLTDQKFTQWYTQLAERIVGYPITSLTAWQQKYVWKNNQLMPVSTPLKITCIVAKP